MAWASMRSRMNRKTMRALNDGSAQHLGNYGATLVPEVMVEFNIERAGPEGIFLTDQVSFTFRKAALWEAPRGSIFVYDCKRYVVEEEIANDGEFVTVACMVQS